MPLIVFSFCAKLGVGDQNRHPEKSDTYWVASQNYHTIVAVDNDTEFKWSQKFDTHTSVGNRGSLCFKKNEATIGNKIRSFAKVSCFNVHKLRKINILASRSLCLCLLIRFCLLKKVLPDCRLSCNLLNSHKMAICFFINSVRITHNWNLKCTRYRNKPPSQ